MKKIKQIYKNKIVKNTIILIICSLLIKILSLINRVALTRVLGNSGISLYIICLPSIMLFMSLGGLSLNIALAKIVSENTVTKRYSEKLLLRKSFIIGLISSLTITASILIFSKYLSTVLLKQPETFYPLICSSILIPIVTINSIIRGFLNGLNKINISAYLTVIEQIIRIIASLLLLYTLSGYGIIFSTCVAIICMGIGELFSFLISLLLIKKNLSNKEKTTVKSDPTKEILSVAIPTTLTRIVGNLTYFLEPIIYTSAMTIILFSSENILDKYSEINAYALPLITMFMFVSSSIATAIIPNVSKYYVSKKNNLIINLTNKALTLSFLPGIFITIILSFYGEEIMYLIYRTKIGSEYVMNLSIYFLMLYVQPPIIACLQAIGKSRIIFIFTTITNSIKLILIYLLTFTLFSYKSLIISMIICVIISTIFLLCYLSYLKLYRFELTKICKYIILTLIQYTFVFIIKNMFTSNIFILCFIYSIFYLFVIKLLRFINFRNI